MKLVLLSISAFVIAASATAQTADHNKWYISAGIGTFGNNLLAPRAVLRDGRLAAKALPSFDLSIKRFITPSFAVGVSGSSYEYNNIQGYKTVADPRMADTARMYGFLIGKEGKYRKTRSLAVECMKIYRRFDDVSIVLYGTAGLGITHTTGYDYNDGNICFTNIGLITIDGFDPKTYIDENKWIADIHPIGIRGGNRLCWYGELGYGYKGIVNVGLGYKL